MTVHVELWELAGTALTLLFAIVAAFWAMAKLMIKQNAADLERRFKEIGKHLTSQDDKLGELEGRVQELHLELARDYVRRDDFVREIGTLGTKFEALAINVERMLRDAWKETLQMIRQEMKNNERR